MDAETLKKRTVIDDNGCWIWQGAIRNKKAGYGAVKFRKKTVDAHRVSFILSKGEIPAGLLVCHTCDIRKCINPDHLFLGTYKENHEDARLKNRTFVPAGFPKGTKSMNRSLTDSQAAEIRFRLQNGERSRDLLIEFKVSKFVISRIKRNQCYN